MRILFVIDSLTIGGAERVVVNLARYFKNKGESPSIIILRNENRFKKELSDIPVYLIKKRYKIDPRFISKLRKKIMDIKPNIINTHLFTASLWTRIALLFSRIPIIVTYHNVLWNEKWYTPFHKFLNIILRRKIKEHIFVSKDVQKFYKKIEALDGRIIYNGIDTDKFYFKERINKNNKNLLFVGRLIERKGISDLFEIMKKLDSDYKLTICGVGQLEDYVKIHLNENIHFIKTTDTPPLYRNHSILIMPSYWEGFPIVPLEALSSDCPVIAYHSPGLIEHPLKDYITFVRSKNIDEFVEKIRNFEYNYTQLKKARQLIERNFSIDAMGKKYCEVFKLWL
jgi:glycosyltransferase involved in cell wall biosynthesis